MRTLQEKYNGIQEGKFSKDQFLVEARRELPNLVTRYNGYDDAIQILKNKGMIKEANLGHNEISSIHQEGGSWIVTYRKNGTQEKVFKTEKEAKDFEKSLSEALNEAEFPKYKADKSPDYRYKPSQTRDEYSSEQLRRGIRVELEAMKVVDTPTAEEFAKAEAKVFKNLAKDPIFYTNQIAGISKKVDLHDKMTPVDQKQLFKTSVAEKSKAEGNTDTFNGLKKAELKEGFKRLIKKVLSEGMESIGDREDWRHDKNDPLHDYMKSKEPKTDDVENYKKEEEKGHLDETEDTLEEGPATNDPKIQKLVDGINQLILQAKDSDGDPIGVIEPGSSWEEPQMYSPLEYRNGALKITTKSPYRSIPSTDVILARNMQFDGIPHLRLIMRMYKKAVKKAGQEAYPEKQDIDETIEYEGGRESILNGILDEWGLSESDLQDPKTRQKVGTELSRRLAMQDLDEIATDVTGFPKWRELSQDEKDHISKSVKDSGDRDQAAYEKAREERLKAQSARLDKYIRGQKVDEDYFSNYGSEEPTAEESETKADRTYNRGADHFLNGAKDIAERLRQQAIRQGQLTHQDEEDFPPYESDGERVDEAAGSESYKGYVIELNPYNEPGQIHTTYSFYNEDDSDELMGTGRSIEDCKEQIDYLIDDKLDEAIDNTQDLVVFSIDSEDLDQILHTNFGTNLAYQDDRGDSLYTLPQDDFDRFMDYITSLVGDQAEDQVNIHSGSDHWGNDADDTSHPRGYEEASDEESFDDLFETVSLKDLL
jgi:hypothetical protein